MLGRTIIPLIPIDGGLNTNAKPWLIGTSESQKCQNFDLGKQGKQGALVKRNGYVRDNTTQFVTGVTTNVYKHVNGTFSYLVSHHSTSPFYYKDTTGANTTVTATLGVNTAWFMGFSGTMYIAGIDTVMKGWNGTSIANTAGSAPANAKAGLEVYSSRLWTAASNVLSGSALWNAEDWTTANNAWSSPVGAKGGETIKRIISQGSRLVVFKSNSIYALHGNAASNFYVQLLTEKTGITSPRSAVCVDGTVFFRGRDGYYVLPERAAEPELISLKITDKILAQTNSTTCCGMIYKDQYWTTYTKAGVTDGVLVLYYKLGKWVEYRGLPNEALYSHNDIPYGAANGYVYQLDSGATDDGSSIAVRWKSPALAYGDLSKDKQFNKTYVSALTNGTHTLSVDHYIDFVDKTDTRTIPLLVASTNQLLTTDKLNWGQGNVGKVEEFEISETSSYTVEIYGVTSYATVLEDR